MLNFLCDNSRYMTYLNVFQLFQFQLKNLFFTLKNLLYTIQRVSCLKFDISKSASLCQDVFSFIVTQHSVPPATFGTTHCVRTSVMYFSMEVIEKQ